VQLQGVRLPGGDLPLGAALAPGGATLIHRSLATALGPAMRTSCRSAIVNADLNDAEAKYALVMAKSVVETDWAAPVRQISHSQADEMLHENSGHEIPGV
jgi:hypothetical protein